MRLILYGRAMGALTVAAPILACNGAPVAATGGADAGAQEARSDSAGPTQDCPFVGSITVDPADTTVGGEVDVTVLVDASDAADISYTWTATGGQFASSNVKETRFDCTAPGEVTIDVQVSGGTEADGGPCIALRSASVRCDPVPAQDATVVSATDPCTVPGQEGCFACTGSPAGLCTPTEEAFVMNDPTGTCYPCLLGAGCIDGAADGATGNECDDLMGDAVTGPSEGAWKPSLCYQVVACILATACANPSVVNCYCGGGDSSACAGAGAAKGPCLGAENAGLETSDAQTALGPSFTSKTLAAGVANAIFVCAAANGCNSCLGSSTGSDAGQGPLEAGALGDP